MAVLVTVVTVTMAVFVTFCYAISMMI